MATEKTGDVQFYNRLFRANSDADGTSYIVHADQVEELSTKTYQTTNNVLGTNITNIVNTISIVNKVPSNGENGTEKTPGSVGDIMIVINA